MLVVMDVKHVAQETVAQVQTTYFLLFIGVLAVSAVTASKKHQETNARVTCTRWLVVPGRL